MPNYRKKDFPVDDVRRFLEPGPIVLVSSAWHAEKNIMTMGWHMIMEFQPSLIGCYIWNENYTHHLIRKSKECVINIPSIEIAKQVVQIGNCSGNEIDKFEKFNLTAEKSQKVKAPLIKECFANFECRLIDTRMIKKYNLFILKVVKAHVATLATFPTTLHYRGDELFMVAGKTTRRYRHFFKPEML